MEDCTHCPEHEAVVAKAKAEEPSAEDLQIMCTLFKLLGDPSRLRIILALTEGELCVYHIQQALGGTQSAISHQLRILKDNRLVKSRREGKNVVYSFYDDHVLSIIRMALEHVVCEKR
ncbi:MAG: ArsR/SmtB family transcription factor [Christensenellaceae bacterium]